MKGSHPVAACVDAAKNPIKAYETQCKELKDVRGNKPVQTRNQHYSSPKKKKVDNSRVQLKEMSNLVEGLLEQNAVIQNTLASLINRSRSTEKVGIGKVRSEKKVDEDLIEISDYN